MEERLNELTELVAALKGPDHRLDPRPPSPNDGMQPAQAGHPGVVPSYKDIHELIPPFSGIDPLLPTTGLFTGLDQARWARQTHLPTQQNPPALDLSLSMAHPLNSSSRLDLSSLFRMVGVALVSICSS